MVSVTLDYVHDSYYSFCCKYNLFLKLEKEIISALCFSYILQWNMIISILTEHSTELFYFSEFYSTMIMKGTSYVLVRISERGKYNDVIEEISVPTNEQCVVKNCQTSEEM